MKLRNPASFFTLLLLAYVIIRCSFLYPKWDKGGSEATLGWDVFGYYLYLPAHFIYGDLGGLGFVEKIMADYSPAGDFHHATQQPDGRWVMKYPLGMSLLYSPFFGIGHLAAGGMGLPQDGFSAPYQFCISLGGWAYAILGLAILRAFLLAYFSDKVTAIVLATLVLATNYLNYTAYDGAMPHNALFTIYAAILWLTRRWHERPGLLLVAAIGALGGLAAIVRPTDLLILLVPMAWGVRGWASLGAKLRLLWERRADVALLALCTALVGSLQLIYWKAYSGHWLYYSYGEQGFYWSWPWLWSGLFSYRKGWFLYTPVMLLAVAGFFPLARRLPQLFLAALGLTLLMLYVVFSWEVWWYGGGFGARPLVQLYAVLSLPLGALWAWLLDRKVWLGLAALFSFLCMDLNLLMTWQTHAPNAGWSAEGMTKAYYWKIFGSANNRKAERKFLDVRHELKDTEGREIQQWHLNDFERDSSAARSQEHVRQGAWALRTDAAQPYSPAFERVLTEADLRPGSWVRVKADAFFTQIEWNEWAMAQLVTLFARDGKHYRITTGRIQRVSDPWAWFPYQYEMKVPAGARPGDLLKVYVWNPGSLPVWIDDLRVEWIGPKP
jgi:hypothetical protein